MLPAGAAPPSTDNVEDYCATQCSYDNIIETAPDNPNVVYAGGSFDYPNGTGGMYRSDDGGQTWIDLGYDQHPDFQVFTFDPNNSNQIVSRLRRWRLGQRNRGGRLAGRAPAQRRQLASLNGQLATRRHDRGDSTNGPADRPVHLDRDGPADPGPLLGRHAGQRHAAQVDGVAVVVRHPERRRRPGAGRPDGRPDGTASSAPRARAASSTARTSTSRRTGWRTAARSSSTTTRSRTGSTCTTGRRSTSRSR